MANKKMIFILFMFLSTYAVLADASLSRSVHKIVPAKGFGMHYDFSDKVGGDFSYDRNRLVEDGSFKADSATVGLTYSFD